MLSAANHAANLRTASRVIRERLGLPTDTGTWSFDQRQRFNQTLAEYIASYPGSFSSDVLEIARRRLQENPATVLLDTSLDFSALLDSAAVTARGLNPFDPSNIGTVGKWLLAAVVVLGIFWLFFNRPPRGPSASRT